MSVADVIRDSQAPNAPSNDDIEAVIQMATSAEGRGPLKDTRTQLWVGNLPYRVRWQDLKDLFRKAGTVLRADVSLGPDNRSRGYGTVLLATAEDAGRAIDMFNGYTWQTRVLEVRQDRMGSEVDQPQNQFEHLNATNNALLGLPAMHSELDYAALLTLDNRPTSASGLAGGRNLFVGNLPFHCQWQDLKDLFRQAGTIIRADVALGQDGRSRGFGTVVFASEADAERALRMFNGYEYNGRALKVHYDKFSQSSMFPASLSPNLPSIAASLSTPASPSPHQQHQKLIPPHLSHLVSTSHLGSSLHPSSPLSLLSGSASPRLASSFPTSRPLSPSPPFHASSPQPHSHGNATRSIVMPAGYTLDFGPSQPGTPYYDGPPSGGFFSGSATSSDWPPRPSSQGGNALKEGELTVSSLAERIMGKGIGGLSIGDTVDSSTFQIRPSIFARTGPTQSAPAGTSVEARGLRSRRPSLANSVGSGPSSTGSIGSGSGSMSRSNSGGNTGSTRDGASGSGGTNSSARTTPLSDAGLEEPSDAGKLEGKTRSTGKQLEKVLPTERTKETPQAHPHHPGTIAIPPPMNWTSHAQPRPSPHHYPYPGYPMSSPSAYPMPHNPAQITPHGLPPITPSMPPFTFYNPAMGSPMPSPALAYPVSPYLMGTPLHSPGIPGYHPHVGMMMITPTGALPPPPPLPQQYQAVPHTEELQRPGTARKRKADDAAEDKEKDTGASNDLEDKSSPKAKVKEDDNPYFNFASVAASQQQEQRPEQQPAAPQAPPHFAHAPHIPMYPAFHPMTPFSPGLAMSPWEPNPYINAAVGAPVHHPGGYFTGATPSSVGVELGSGRADEDANINGYFDSVYRQPGSGSSKEATPEEPAVECKPTGPTKDSQKRANSYNTDASSHKVSDMARTYSMSSSGASRPQLLRPDSDPGNRKPSGEVVVSPTEDVKA